MLCMQEEEEQEKPGMGIVEDERQNQKDNEKNKGTSISLKRMGRLIEHKERPKNRENCNIFLFFAILD